MSYILDALKSSDQDRNRGKAPTLQSQPERLGRSRATPRKRASKYVLPLLVLVLAAGLVVGAMFKSTIIGDDTPATPMSANVPADNPADDVTSVIETAVPEQAEVLPAASEVSLDELKDVQLFIAPVDDPGVPASPETGAQSAESAVTVTEERVIEPAPSQEVQQVEPGEETSAASVEADAPPDPYEGIPNQRQLAIELQRELPDMSISVHVYSAKPGSRLVRIDNTVYREGDFVASELKLEEITPNGMIMSFRDTRFWRLAR